MSLQEGPAFGGLILGMGLAFILNHAGKPIWFSLLAGVVFGVADYFLITRFKRRGKRNEPEH